MRLKQFGLLWGILIYQVGCSVDGLQQVTIPECEDANPCTVGDYTDRTNECFFLPVEDGTQCSLGNPCVASSSCQEGICVAQQFVSCDDANPCTGDICNENTGECSNPAVSDGTVCPSLDACFVDALCTGGECVPATPVDCNDFNPCTVGICGADDGICDYENLPDGTPCGTDLICEQGICISIDFPPSAPIVEILPQSPTDSDELICAIIAQGIDPNGDIITYSYKWFINDVLIPENTSAQIVADSTLACDVYRCVVTPMANGVVGASGEDTALVTPDDICFGCPTLGDQDGDTVLDDVDNCPLIANLDQEDIDGDGIGNPCDLCWLDGNAPFSLTPNITSAGLMLSNVKINDGQPVLAHVPNNSTVNVKFDYAVVGANCDSCPGCVTQYSLGISPGHECSGVSGEYSCFYSGGSGCNGASYGEADFNLATPSEPGMYFLTPKRSWHYSCAQADEAGWLTSPINPDIAVAAMCVGQSCDDDNPCTTDEWNSSTGECTNTPVENGVACSEDLCSPASCEDSICVFEDAIDCDDDDPCTVDTCLSANGDCDYETLPDFTPCGDGLVCIDGDCIPLQTDFTVDITPEQPLENEDLECTVTTSAVDPNGGEVTYAFAWSVDDDESETYDGLQFIPAAATEVCETWTCSAKALFDGQPGELATDSVLVLPTSECEGCPTDGDQDGDGVLDINDNCIVVVNPEQEDTDQDGIGDLCDSCWLDGPNPMMVSGNLDYAGIEIRNALLNGAATTSNSIGPGDNFTIAFDYTVVGASCDYCPGCVTQFSLGVSTASACIGPSEDYECFSSGGSGCYGNYGGSKTITLEAPTEEGMYFITPKRSWHYSCSQANSAGWLNPIINPATAVVAFCVRPQ